MHVVNLSLDPHLLDAESVVSSRVRRYGDAVGSYTVLVPSKAAERVTLSEKVEVYGVSGGKLLQLARMFLLLRKLVRENQCDVITSQDAYFLGLISLFVSKLYGLGVEIQILGIEKPTFLRKRLARFVLARAHVVRALSVRVREILLTEYGVEPEKMNLVPIYVDTSALGFDAADFPMEQQQRLKEKQVAFRKQYGPFFNFVTVCRLVPVKNIEQQILALTEVVQKHPKVRLHIVGDGPDRESLMELVSKTDLQEFVVFHGAQYADDLNPFFTQTDTFLLTSFSEGWGMVIIEASLARLSVIMSDVGCAGEIIVHESSGLVIGSHEELVAAMCRMIENPNDRQRFADAARANVLALPTFEELLEKYTMSWRKAYKKAGK